MISSKIYLPKVAWRTNIINVVKLGDYSYSVNVAPIDANEPGAHPLIMGDYLKDYIGHTYKITSNNNGLIEIADEFEVGMGPQTSHQAIVYKSVKNGNAPYLSPTYYRHLDKSALEYSWRIEVDILWKPDPIRIEFENTATPKIENYNSLYSELYGELPNVRLVTYDSEGVEWMRQEVPIIYKTDDLIDSIEFDLSDIYSGYIILSK